MAMISLDYISTLLSMLIMDIEKLPLVLKAKAVRKRLITINIFPHM